MSLSPLARFLLEGSAEDQADAQRGEYHLSHGVNPRFWGSTGAGVMLTARSTGRKLWMLRSRYVNEPGTWGLIGGKIDDNEDPEVALQREVAEETGLRSGVTGLRLVDTFKSDNFQFFNYVGFVEDEFTPILNWENSDFRWLAPGDFPSPLHFGVERIIGKLNT